MKIEFSSSGTTGTPKRVTVDYHGIIESGKDALKIIGHRNGVFLNVFPPNFIGWYIAFEYAIQSNSELLWKFRDDVTMVVGLGAQVKEVLKQPNSIQVVVVAKGTVDDEIEQLCQGKELYETYGTSEWGRAWITCKDRSQGFHIGKGMSLTEEGLTYNGICSEDFSTLTTEPCPACGFQGQRLTGKIVRGSKPYICQ